VKVCSIINCVLMGVGMMESSRFQWVVWYDSVFLFFFGFALLKLMGLYCSGSGGLFGGGELYWFCCAATEDDKGDMQVQADPP
jgi:hypothetical protein